MSNGITVRERFLMKQAAQFANDNGGVDEWLKIMVSDCHTVEQILDSDADDPTCNGEDDE